MPYWEDDADLPDFDTWGGRWSPTKQSRDNNNSSKSRGNSREGISGAGVQVKHHRTGRQVRDSMVEARAVARLGKGIRSRGSSRLPLRREPEAARAGQHHGHASVAAARPGTGVVVTLGKEGSRRTWKLPLTSKEVRGSVEGQWERLQGQETETPKQSQR